MPMKYLRLVGHFGYAYDFLLWFHSGGFVVFCVRGFCAVLCCFFANLLPEFCFLRFFVYTNLCSQNECCE